MSGLDKLNSLRSHIEVCCNILNELESMKMRESIGYESYMKVVEIKEFIRLAKINAMKATIECKHHNNIPITPHTVVLPERIMGDHEYPGDAEIVEAELAEMELDRMNELERQRKKTARVYHPDVKLNKVIQIYCEMGGVSLDKLIKPFNVNPPAIEFYSIMEFINEIKEMREKNNKYKDCAVYAHLCEYSSIYVGIAKLEFEGTVFETHEKAVMARMHEHRNWPSSRVKANWTAINKVITPLFFLPGDKKDEDLITQLLSICIGSNKVRGGMFTYIGPIDFPDITINEIKNKLFERS